MRLVKARHVVLTGERMMLCARESTATDPRIDKIADGIDRPLAENCSDAASQEDALRARIAELEGELTAYQDGLDTRLGEAFEQGRKAAQKTFFQSEAERIATLRDSAKEALCAFDQRLGLLDRTANDIALAALERVLGDASFYASFVSATIRRRLSMIAEGSVLTIRVAAVDFPDDDALHQIRSTLPAASSVELIADPLLPAGTCLLDLRLGKIDASIPLQHERLEAVLRESQSNG